MVQAAQMTVAEWQAGQIEKAGKILAHFIESTKEDRLRWRPATEDGSKTRSVLEQCGECIFANQRFLSYLQSQTPPPPPESFDSFSSVADATTQLKSSAKTLADEIRKIAPDDLMREVTTHRGPMPVALAIQFPLRNMIYHMGQINMIQLLYGDAEFHIDEEFTSL